jgi:N-acetylmuramoyl-L-alanine amidase
MKHRVFIVVGHGGGDPGAVANGFQEKLLNLEIALACRDELMRHDVEVGMSRTVDEGETAEEQAKECNAFDPELGVCIHNNAGGGDGAEAYHHYGGGKGKVLAQNILDEVQAIGQNSRGLKIRKNAKGQDYYHIIRETNCPMALIECCFLDNKEDVQIIDTAQERKTFGIAIAKGILKTLGVTYIEPTPVCKLQLPVLRLGDHGDTVKSMQILLIGHKYFCGASGADGDFGSFTEFALRKFQKTQGLTVTGICDQTAWESLLY